MDRDGDGTAELSFRNPDFNVRTFRSNLVLRWEYRPGSTLFVVWSQDRSGVAPAGDTASSEVARTTPSERGSAPPGT